MNTRFKVKAYLKFLSGSTNQHGVHSPFVYQLVTQCFYKRRTHEQYRQIKTLQQKLGTSPQLSRKQRRLLNRLTRYFTPQHLFNFSRNTSVDLALSLAAPQAQIFSLKTYPPADLSPVIAQALQPIQSVNLETLKQCSLPVDKLDLAFIDFHAMHISLKEAYHLLIDYAHNDSVFIFKAIHQSDIAEQEWQYIKTQHHVRLTIDTFYWGLVFFRKEQAKQHFSIRV